MSIPNDVSNRLINMRPKTRREFLQGSVYAAATAAFVRGPFAWSDMAASSPPVKVWITSEEQKFSPAQDLTWSAATNMNSESIQIDPHTWYQEILGFGGAFTDASCFLFSQLNPSDRKTLFDELFGPEGLRFSMGRTCIGSSDYTTSIYSLDDSPEPDPNLKRFSIEHDRAYILPTLRMAREVNPDIFLFAAPWSPPAWMKPNHSMLGGSMERKYFDAYAKYFVRFLQSYAAEGVKVNAVTVQNEVDTNQNSSMPACLWAQEDEARFVARHLGRHWRTRH